MLEDAANRRHGFHVTQATLAGAQLRFTYFLRWQGARLTKVRLVADQAEWSLDTRAPGHLSAPVPPAGGRLLLVVDEVAGLPPEAPHLPWEVGLFLAPQAVADYWAAEPCGAVLRLPSGEALQVVRLLRRTDITQLFMEQPPASLYLLSELLADEQEVGEAPYPYRSRWFDSDTDSEALSGEPGGPDLKMMVDVFTYGPTISARRLSLLVSEVAWEDGGTRSLSISVPPHRPVAMTVDIPFPVDDLRLHLDELWLGLHASALVLHTTGAVHLMPLSSGITMVDQEGHEYTMTAPFTRRSGGSCLLEPIPANITTLTIIAHRVTLVAQGRWELPLTEALS